MKYNSTNIINGDFFVFKNQFYKYLKAINESVCLYY